MREGPGVNYCLGRWHHSGSVDIERAQRPGWWPQTVAEKKAIWAAFSARFDELKAERKRLKKEAAARGEAEPSAQGEKLTAADRLVMRALLFDFANRQNGRCDPSQQRLAKATGLHRATVARSLARLYRFGVLVWERRRQIVRRGRVWWMGQASNLYAFVRAMSQKASGTPNSYISKDSADLSTVDPWAGRLRREAAKVQREEEARRKHIERQKSLWADYF